MQLKTATNAFATILQHIQWNHNNNNNNNFTNFIELNVYTSMYMIYCYTFVVCAIEEDCIGWNSIRANLFRIQLTMDPWIRSIVQQCFVWQNMIFCCCCCCWPRPPSTSHYRPLYGCKRKYVVKWLWILASGQRNHLWERIGTTIHTHTYAVCRHSHIVCPTNMVDFLQLVGRRLVLDCVRPMDVRRKVGRLSVRRFGARWSPCRRAHNSHILVLLTLTVSCTNRL